MNQSQSPASYSCSCGKTKKGRRRSKTIARKQMARERKTAVIDEEMVEWVETARPKTRRECIHRERPCLFVVL